ncbi:MAG: hypothetical protein AAFP03_10430 [Cyanobacteria bacterium J06598_3]
MFEKSVPSWLVGVWKRLSIEENGQKDTTTQVIWIQTHSCFGDIRIPADRPMLEPAIGSVQALSPAQAIALSHQAGFAGITRFHSGADGDLCQWHRALDYRPFEGQFDIGRVHWQGDILIETGIESTYTEEWQRIETGPTAALTLLRGPMRQAWLVMCGDWFIYGCDRRFSLPAAGSLTELVEASSVRETLVRETLQQPPLVGVSHYQYLNCEISLGHCQTGSVPWKIQNSTLPWKVGRSLWQDDELTLDKPNRRLIQSNKQSETIWAVQEWGHLEQLL